MKYKKKSEWLKVVKILGFIVVLQAPIMILIGVLLIQNASLIEGFSYLVIGVALLIVLWVGKY